MRLIDADAIHYCNYDLDNYHSFRAIEEDEIAEMPTIDAVEVVHGQWVWKDGKVFCSVCTLQGEQKYHYEDGEVEEYPYCPNCGAKMDLKE
jgi:hypothetical protein